MSLTAANTFAVVIALPPLVTLTVTAAFELNASDIFIVALVCVKSKKLLVVATTFGIVPLLALIKTLLAKTLATGISP